MNKFIVPDEIEQIAQRFTREGGEFYIVGGYVRDHLLGIRSDDIDCMVSNMPLSKFRKVCNELHIDPKSLVPNAMVHVIYIEGVGKVDIAFSAREGGKGIFIPASAMDDAFRRDISINAIFMKYVSGDWVIVDFCNGINDISDKVLRVCDPRQWSKSEDRVNRLGVIWSILPEFSVADEALTLAKAISPALVNGEQHWKQGLYKWASRGNKLSNGWKFWMEIGWADNPDFPAFKLFQFDNDIIMSELDKIIMNDGHQKAVTVFATISEIIGDAVVQDVLLNWDGVANSFANDVWKVFKPNVDIHDFSREANIAIMQDQPNRKPDRWLSMSSKIAYDLLMNGYVDEEDGIDLALCIANQM
jgi:hypothetical protein